MNKIAIIGLGYVGLPLATLFSKKYSVIGFDINNNRIKELNKGIDVLNEVSKTDLKKQITKKGCFENNNIGLLFSSDINSLKKVNIFIITIPTPVDKRNIPDLKPLYKASEYVAINLKKNDIVIYESTVYPGTTEEECVPILEKKSGLKFNNDFFVGYSPERINPGDKTRKLENILKITSGSNKKTAKKINELYKSVIKAGTYLAPSIKVAEAAKIIENTQRDINIAFINELSKIFNLLEIDTHQVLEAAATKWNFLPFQPGLVGGHCIGVDPFYLAKKAKEVGYTPEIILAGRKINDSMAEYVATQVIKLMIKKEINIIGSKLLVLGIAFKENCNDIRNSKTIEVVKILKTHQIEITIYDPLVNPKKLIKEHGLVSKKTVKKEKFDGIILAVAHTEFLNLNISEFKKKKSVLYDVKGVLPYDLVDGRL